MSPAIAWLWATFDKRRRYHVNHDYQNRGPMISLKTDMEPEVAMRVTLSDYGDPLRWWL